MSTALRAPRRTGPPMTPVHQVEQCPTFAKGLDSPSTVEAWSAESVDGIWRYQRLEGSAVETWDVLHRPTGHIEPARDLDRARQWTASPAALARIRGHAESVVAAHGRMPSSALVISFPPSGLTAEQAQRWRADRDHAEEQAAADRLARARIVLAVLDGRLLPAGAGMPEGACECGGLLAFDAEAKAWRHVNGCRHCWSPETDWTADAICMTPVEHEWCGDPEPVRCEHSQCKRNAVLGSQPCGSMREWCCGCCHSR